LIAAKTYLMMRTFRTFGAFTLANAVDLSLKNSKAFIDIKGVSTGKKYNYSMSGLSGYEWNTDNTILTQWIALQSLVSREGTNTDVDFSGTA
jgi:hypothetical protein